MVDVEAKTSFVWVPRAYDFKEVEGCEQVLLEMQARLHRTLLDFWVGGQMEDKFTLA